MLVGTCYICSAPAMFTCTVCGRTACISCYDKDSRLCRNCNRKLGREPFPGDQEDRNGPPVTYADSKDDGEEYNEEYDDY